MIHNWWSGNISFKTVRPLFEDHRIHHVSWKTLKMCLMGRWRGRRPEQIYEELRELVDLLSAFHGSMVESTRCMLRETRDLHVEHLENGSAVIQYIRSQHGWLEVWNMLHAWWSNRITLKTVLPLLEDARINQVPFDNIRECLCGPAATAKRHQNADALKAMLEQLRPIYEECKKDARQALRETSRDSLKALKNHPMAKVFQMVRGRRGWADAIPEEVDIESLPLANEVIRCLFLPRAEHAEREMQEELDAAAVEGVKAKPLRAVLMCLEMQPATLKQLEADLQKAIPEELLPLISAKGGLIAPDARNRLHAVLQRRRSYRDI